MPAQDSAFREVLVDFLDDQGRIGIGLGHESTNLFTACGRALVAADFPALHAGVAYSNFFNGGTCN